jgi:hypothetical protein
MPMAPVIVIETTLFNWALGRKRMLHLLSSPDSIFNRLLGRSVVSPIPLLAMVAISVARSMRCAMSIHY